jgi:hypothetical protein
LFFSFFLLNHKIGLLKVADIIEINVDNAASFRQECFDWIIKKDLPGGKAFSFLGKSNPLNAERRSSREGSGERLSLEFNKQRYHIELYCSKNMCEVYYQGVNKS